MNSEPSRWEYRFRNYSRALNLLREAIDAMIEAEANEAEFTQLEKEGTIQRFEYTMELAWNVLKDYLQHQGVSFQEVTPRITLRKAFQANVIADGDTWMSALDARNKMSHTYDLEKFEEVIKDIRRRYLPALEDLHSYLLEKALNES